jgi:hypothetical protein
MMLLKIKQKNAVQHLKDLPVSCMCLPNTEGKFQRLASGQHVRVEPVLTSQKCKKLSKIQMVLQLLVAILNLEYLLGQNRFLARNCGTPPQHLRLKIIKPKQERLTKRNAKLKF